MYLQCYALGMCQMMIIPAQSFIYVCNYYRMMYGTMCVCCIGGVVWFVSMYSIMYSFLSQVQLYIIIPLSSSVVYFPQSSRISLYLYYHRSFPSYNSQLLSVAHFKIPKTVLYQQI